MQYNASFRNKEKINKKTNVYIDLFDGVFCAVLFPPDVLDEIWDLIESVSEGFLTYSCE